MKKTRNAMLHDVQWVGYQNRTNLVAHVKECEAFYRGDQWPGNNVYNEVRVTINKIQQGIRLIASKLNGTPLYISYTAMNGAADCTKIRRFDEYVRNEMNHDSFSLQSAINGENTGTEITYCYWDQDDTMQIGGFYQGGMHEEHISPLCFAVANPHEHDTQRQRWVMYWTDMYVYQIKELIEQDDTISASKRREKISDLMAEAERSVERDGANPDKDILNDVMLRVYDRYFRIDGEVCHEIATNTVQVNEYPIPLSSQLKDDFAKAVVEAWAKAEKDDKDQLVKDLEIDFENVMVQGHKKLAEDHKGFMEKFSLYPFEQFTPIVINNSYFGASKTEQMMRLQKAINYNASLVVKAAENVSAGKLIAKPGSIRQTLTNQPGEIVWDYYEGPGDGIKPMQYQPLPNDVTNFNSYLGNEMKETYGFSDVMSGNVSNQDISGYAVQQMIKQANTPLEQEQMLFWTYQKRLARIRFMFYKHYVDEAAFSFELSNAEYDQEEQSRKAILQGLASNLQLTDPDTGKAIPSDVAMRFYSQKTSRSQVRRFKRKEVWGTDYAVDIRVKQGVLESELSYQQFFQNMITSGAYKQLDADTLSLIVECAPNSVIPEEGRATMRYYAEQRKHSQLAQAEAHIQQLEQVIAQLQGQVQGAQTYNNALKSEFNQRLGAAQAANNLAMQRGSMSEEGVTEGEVHSNNARGIQGSSVTQNA